MLLVVGLATVWSAIRPHDYATWFFELFIGLIGVGVLVATARQFQFSALAYGVVAAHFVVLALGAKYTYSNEPIFNWLKEVFNWQRNHFDRVGHYFQGVTPALVTREVLMRTTGLGRSRWVPFLAVCVALAFSGLYEVLEWLWVVIFYPNSGPEWLGMQGDPWDAQGDMLMALCGGLTSVIVLARWHDRSMAALRRAP
jgi:putative membrane protein